GADVNVLYGQAGNDIFGVEARLNHWLYDSATTIADFRAGDRIDVSAWGISSFDQIQRILETRNGTDAFFNAYYGDSGQNSIQISRVLPGALTAASFVFDTSGARETIGTDYADRLFGSTEG
ncbi:hypothetical protein, partial [Rhodobacter sp. NSM]|uniref:hypothetical protein n=1 Tax=Rhodobacter sp. NSM TaxID=3457501 RepID=UPI003FD5C079